MLPAICIAREDFVTCQAVHDIQLRDMQSVVERTRNHRQQRARLLIKRPETQVIAREISAKGVNGFFKKLPGGSVLC